MEFTFATVDVKDEIFKALRDTLPKKGLPKVKVIKADPALPSELPCIGINRASDDESEQTIADDHGTHYDPTTQVYTVYKGTFFQEAIEVRVWHTNADERDEVYRMVRTILFAHRTELVKKGLLNISLRGGRDEQDTSMQFAPKPIYWGVITMTYLNPLNVDILETVEKISGFTDAGTLQVGG